MNSCCTTLVFWFVFFTYIYKCMCVNMYIYVYMCIHKYFVHRQEEYACTCIYVLNFLRFWVFFTCYISLGNKKGDSIHIFRHPPPLFHSSGSSHCFSMLRNKLLICAFWIMRAQRSSLRWSVLLLFFSFDGNCGYIHCEMSNKKLIIY